MVARTATLQRIDIGLHAIESALDDLPEIEAEWDTLPDGERASWALDWDHLMGTYLVVLHRSAGADEMTARQQSRYRRVLDRLSDSRPVIERLNLHRPPLALG
jgi:hypothetical protein